MNNDKIQNLCRLKLNHKVFVPEVIHIETSKWYLLFTKDIKELLPIPILQKFQNCVLKTSKIKVEALGQKNDSIFNKNKPIFNSKLILSTLSAEA